MNGLKGLSLLHLGVNRTIIRVGQMGRPRRAQRFGRNTPPPIDITAGQLTSIPCTLLHKGRWVYVHNKWQSRDWLWLARHNNTTCKVEHAFDKQALNNRLDWLYEPVLHRDTSLLTELKISVADKKIYTAPNSVSFLHVVTPLINNAKFSASIREHVFLCLLTYLLHGAKPLLKS